MSGDRFYKEDPLDQIWWVDTSDEDGKSFEVFKKIVINY